MNIIVLSVITKQIRNTYAFLASDSVKQITLVKFYNHTVKKIDNTIKIFWLSTIFFIGSMYCFILYKFDLVNSENTFLWTFISVLFVICYFILLISDIQDKSFFKEHKIEYSHIDIMY